MLRQKVFNYQTYLIELYTSIIFRKLTTFIVKKSDNLDFIKILFQAENKTYCFTLKY